LSIGDYNGSTYNPRLWVFTTYTQINNSTRSPLFYDSDNTGYYVDPASTGVAVNVAGEIRTIGEFTSSNYMVGGSQSGALNIGRIDTDYRWEGTSWGTTTNLGILANCLDHWEFGVHDSGSRVSSAFYYDGVNHRFLMGRDLGWAQAYIEAAASFRAPIFYDSNNTAYYTDPASTSILVNMSLGGGQTVNGQSHYQWEGATYRNPGDHIPGLLVRADNATAGINGSRPAISLYNENGGDQTTVAMAFVSREAQGSGNAVNLAGIVAKKEIAGDSGNWTSGSLTLYTRQGGTRRDAFYIDPAGFAQSPFSLRAPIFYDTDNTGFYIDAASTSNVNAMVSYSYQGNGNVGGTGSASWHPSGIYSAGYNWLYGGISAGGGDITSVNLLSATKLRVISAGNQAGGNIKMGQTGEGAAKWSYLTGAHFNDTSEPEGISLIGSYSSSTANQVVIGGSIYEANPATEILFYTHTATTHSTGGSLRLSIDTNGAVIAQVDMRAPIFYDNNNTGYYVDPAGTASANFAGYTYFANHGGGIVGNYSSYRYQLVWAIGDSYKGSLDGTSVAGGYGLWFSHPNAGGVASNLSTHGLMLIQNGSFMASLDPSMRAVNDMRAPIFYDLNNTAFYTDPNTTSVLSALTLGGRSTTNAVFYAGFTLDANTMPTNSTGFTYAVNAPFTGPIMRVGDGGYDLWFNAPYGGGGRLAFRTRNGDTASINAWQYPALYNQNVNGGGDLYATIYYDQNNTAYYTDPTSTSSMNIIGFATNSAQIAANETSTYGSVVVRGSRNGWRGIHFEGGGNTPALMFDGSANGGIYFEGGGRWASYYSYAANCWGFGTSTTSAAYNIYCPTGVYSGGRNDGTIFYDSNDNSFYVDPNSVSRMDVIRANSYGRVAHNTGFLLGGYNNIGASEGQSSPIYCIGSSYVPSTTTLSNMYGIGFTASGSFFPSGASGWGLYIADNGNARIFLDASGGNITATGNITAYASDRRLKTNITPISNALDKVMKIRGVEFDWVDNIVELGFQPQSMHETGVIAQEIQAVISDAVRIAPFNKMATDISGVDNEYLTVDKEKIVPLLIEAIKELKAEIEMLKAR
jgi:hypothetical protein